MDDEVVVVRFVWTDLEHVDSKCFLELVGSDDEGVVGLVPDDALEVFDLVTQLHLGLVLHVDHHGFIFCAHEEVVLRFA